jgi:hypothetical protein
VGPRGVDLDEPQALLCGHCRDEARIKDGRGTQIRAWRSGDRTSAGRDDRAHDNEGGTQPTPNDAAVRGLAPVFLRRPASSGLRAAMPEGRKAALRVVALAHA